jgi:uncharacterized alkaline shock family protein YloU
MDEREISRVVHAAAESVYGVAEVVGPGVLDRLRARLGVAASGVSVSSTPSVAITVDLRVADGVPVGQVATNVAEQVRYVLERDLGVHVANLTVRVDGKPVGTS